MGRLEALKGRQEMWGYQDSRRLASLRLDKEFRDSESQPNQSSIEPPDLLDVIFDLESKVKALTIEVRSENVRLRNSVALLSKNRTRRGGEGTY